MRAIMLGLSMAGVIGAAAAAHAQSDPTSALASETIFLTKALTLDTAPDYCIKVERDDFDRCLFVQRGERTLLAHLLTDAAKGKAQNLPFVASAMSLCIVAASEKETGPDYVKASRCYDDTVQGARPAASAN